MPVEDEGYFICSSFVLYVVHWLISYNAYGRQTTAMNDGSWMTDDSYGRRFMDDRRQFMNDGS